jgi:hypothetical protein
MDNIEELMSAYSYVAVGFGFALLLGLSALSLLLKHPKKKVKTFVFVLIIAVTLIPTFFLASSTIYVNAISTSKGPVHWHADFEIWSCGKELDLLDPVGLSNKIGTPTLHEHNDKRIHLEGVVIKPSDATLGKFFTVIGGTLQSNVLSVPTTDGMQTLQSGTQCDGVSSELQFFVFKTDKDGYYHQEKLVDPASYSISAQQNVPSGDCIIAEVSAPKERTEKMCRSYKVAEKIGKLKGERN